MFSVDLVARECDGYVIVELRGELDMADAAAVADALTAEAVGRRPVVVDLAGLAFIDCRGTAALARAQSRVRKAGGHLLLAAPQPRVRRVFVLSRLVDLSTLHASVQQAVGAMASGWDSASRDRNNLPV